MTKNGWPPNESSFYLEVIDRGDVTRHHPLGPCMYLQRNVIFGPWLRRGETARQRRAIKHQDRASSKQSDKKGCRFLGIIYEIKTVLNPPSFKYGLTLESHGWFYVKRIFKSDIQKVSLPSVGYSTLWKASSSLRPLKAPTEMTWGGKNVQTWLPYIHY